MSYLPICHTPSGCVNGEAQICNRKHTGGQSYNNEIPLACFLYHILLWVPWHFMPLLDCLPWLISLNFALQNPLRLDVLVILLTFSFTIFPTVHSETISCCWRMYFFLGVMVQLRYILITWGKVICSHFLGSLAMRVSMSLHLSYQSMYCLRFF